MLAGMEAALAFELLGLSAEQILGVIVVVVLIVVVASILRGRL